jgi:NADH-quinone oxidoreductase subunit N
MFSLAGIPPTAGFMGKFYLFSAAVRAGLTPLAVVGVLTSVVGVAYYLRVVIAVMLKDPDVAWTRGARTTLAPAVAILLAILGTLAIGISPSLLYDVAVASAAALR